MNATRAREEHILPLDTMGDATPAMRVTERSTMSAQVSGGHTTGKVRMQWRLTGGSWIDAMDSTPTEIEITGEGIKRNIDVTGVDEVRWIVQTTETGKEALVIQEAWGDER